MRFDQLYDAVFDKKGNIKWQDWPVYQELIMICNVAKKGVFFGSVKDKTISPTEIQKLKQEYDAMCAKRFEDCINIQKYTD